MVGRGEVTEARVERRQVLRVTGLALTGAVRARRPKDKEEKRDGRLRGGCWFGGYVLRAVWGRRRWRRWGAGR